MKYRTRMALLNHMDEKDRRDMPKHYPEPYGSEYTPPYANVDRDYRGAENRFRDRKGREHYNSGRYAPMNTLDDGHHTDSKVIGFAQGAHDLKHHESGLDEAMAEEWMAGLHNADGTKGPHWDKEQVRQLVNQRKLDMDPIEAWVALNSIYSDYCKVAKAHNVNNIDFYVAMAKAFAEDEDAKDDKLALYYECIVK